MEKFLGLVVVSVTEIITLLSCICHLVIRTTALPKLQTSPTLSRTISYQYVGMQACLSNMLHGKNLEVVTHIWTHPGFFGSSLFVLHMAALITCKRKTQTKLKNWQQNCTGSVPVLSFEILLIKPKFRRNGIQDYSGRMCNAQLSSEPGRLATEPGATWKGAKGKGVVNEGRV